MASEVPSVLPRWADSVVDVRVVISMVAGLDEVEILGPCRLEGIEIDGDRVLGINVSGQHHVFRP